MLDETGFVHVMSITRFEQFCKGCDPDQAGMLFDGRQILFGIKREEIKIILSVEKVQDFIREEPGLAGVKKEDMLFVFWVETLNPLNVAWCVLTQEDIDGMEEDEREHGIIPSRKH